MYFLFLFLYLRFNSTLGFFVCVFLKINSNFLGGVDTELTSKLKFTLKPAKRSYLFIYFYLFIY